MTDDDPNDTYASNDVRDSSEDTNSTPCSFRFERNMLRFVLAVLILGLLTCFGCSDDNGGDDFQFVSTESLCAEQERFDGRAVEVVSEVDWVSLCDSETDPLCDKIGASLSCSSSVGGGIAIVGSGGAIYQCGDPAPDLDLCIDRRFRSGGEQAVIRGIFRDEPTLVPVDGIGSTTFDSTLEFETFGAAEY